MIIRWQKKQEYLIIRLYQDLAGDWVVSETRGAHPETPHYTHTLFASYLEARQQVIATSRQQRKLGYCKTGVKEEQLTLDFS